MLDIQKTTNLPSQLQRHRLAAWLGASLPCCFKRTLAKRYGDHCRERHQADVLAGAIIGVVQVCQKIPPGIERSWSSKFKRLTVPRTV